MKHKTTLFFLILVLAICLRLPHLDERPEGIDEGNSIMLAKFIESSYSLTYPYVPLPNEKTPPLFFHIVAIPLFIHDSITSMRVLMVLIGILSIIVFYLLARKLFDEEFAIFSMFLYAINPMHIIYSQHIRAYILLTLLFPLSLYFLYKFLLERNSRSLIYLTIIYIISFYCHYFAMLYIIGGAVTVLIFYFINKNIKLSHYFLSILMLAILIIPGLLLAIQQFVEYKVMGADWVIMPLLTPSIVPYPLWKFSVMADVSTTLSSFPYLVLLFPLLLGLAAYGAFLLYKENKAKFVFIVSNLSLPYIIYAIAGFIFPIFSFRYITFLLPLYVMLFSYGLFKIKNKMLKLILLFILIAGWCIVIAFFYSIMNLEDWGFYIAV